MAIANALISGAQVLLTVPAGKRYAVTTIMVCNTATPESIDTDEGITDFDMHFIKSGDSRSDANTVVRALELPAGETFTFDSEKIVIEDGDTIEIVGSSPEVLVATVSYMEV